MGATVATGVSRRQVLGALGALGAAVAVPLAGPRFGAASPSPSELTLARFAPYVGSEFTVRTGTLETRRLTLVEATAPAPHPVDRRDVTGESFSLVFADHQGKSFDDRSYTLSHRSLGTFSLFLVAIGRGVSGQRYQAVVDRRSPSR
jgi:hypothetical protein